MTAQLAAALAAHHAPLWVPPVTAAGVVWAAGSAPDPVSALQTYGVLGVIVALMLLGWLVPKYVYDRLVTENERLRLLAESTGPLLAKNADVTAEAVALIRLLREELGDRHPRSSA